MHAHNVMPPLAGEGWGPAGAEEMPQNLMGLLDMVRNNESGQITQMS